MNLETKITIYKFTPQVFTLTPFPKVGQGLLNGRLLQSAAVDRTVHYSRLYGPLQRIIQSAAGDCSNPTERRA